MSTSVRIADISGKLNSSRDMYIYLTAGMHTDHSDRIRLTSARARTRLNQGCELMDSQEVTKTERTDFRRDFQESCANRKSLVGRLVARGAGFEPARPKGPQA
jgi:hypothetical protein